MDLSGLLRETEVALKWDGWLLTVYSLQIPYHHGGTVRPIQQCPHH